MQTNYKLPPDPQNAVLTRIYPWDEYNITIVMQQLFAQASKTGFTGTFDDFQQRYGSYIEAQSPQDIYNLIENYTGAYHITPLVSVQQVLQTKNKVLNQNIIIDPVPESIIDNHEPYHGRYQVTPMARLDQILRTEDKVLSEDVVIEKIPYAEVSNTAGGTTVIIG